MSSGLHLIFLIKNKIEKPRENMKNWLHINAQNFPTVQDAILDYFKSRNSYIDLYFYFLYNANKQ